MEEAYATPAAAVTAWAAAPNESVDARSDAAIVALVAEARAGAADAHAALPLPPLDSIGPRDPIDREQRITRQRRLVRDRPAVVTKGRFDPKRVE